MEQIHFTEPSATHQIQTLFKASRLIPFFGSGFTKGTKAKRGRVPDASELTKLITDVAAERLGINSTERFEIAAISSLKSAFGLLDMPEYITKKQAQSLLSNLFSEVDLADRAKIDLLKIDWPHIFTFNVDDAIERTSRNFRLLPPNRKTSREFIASHKCLFKIHGDISEFSAHEDSSLIFTWRDYVHSVENNKAILSFLSEEAQNSALLFIGCSLDAELDLIHITKQTAFSKSIFVKKGLATVAEKIALKDYGINKIIYFDNYDEIATWLTATLRGINREKPVRDITFDDRQLSRDEAIRVIASGGPVYQISGKTRVARTSSTFASRTAISDASRALRNKECLLITGRRFSGKTLFAFQIVLALKEFGVTFWGSTDSYDPSVMRELERLESHLFVFDTNSLDFESLNEVLRAKIHPTSRLILCASSGDAETFRFRLSDKNVNFDEVKLPSTLDEVETGSFNRNLGHGGLPLYKRTENLLAYAFRCYEEFKHNLGHSSLFSKSFSSETYLILILIAAFGKAEKKHIDAILQHFDIADFTRKNDRVFETETLPAGSIALVCNASAWLLKSIHNFVDSDKFAYQSFARVITSLEQSGFSILARDLIRFDKLNEMSGGHSTRLFIRNLYSEIASTYSDESHYWLQRSKAELISARTYKDIADGVVYAKKVRLDNADPKNKTYFSATLVLTQLFARGYKITKEDKYLVDLVEPCIESITNYQNNRRHIDEMAAAGDVIDALERLYDKPILELLPKKDRIQTLFAFFGVPQKKPSRPARR